MTELITLLYAQFVFAQSKFDGNKFDFQAGGRIYIEWDIFKVMKMKIFDVKLFK